MKLLLLVLFLNTPFVNAQQYMDDYFPLIRKWAPTVNPNNGSVVGAWAMTNDRIYWASGGTTQNMNWSSVTGSELFEYRDNCSDGQSYLFLNGYKPHNTSLPSNVTWWIKPTKILITTGTNIFDITNIAIGNSGCSKTVNNLNGSGVSHKVGMPFAPLQFWNQPYLLQVWGEIADRFGNFSARSFYWHAKWQPYQTGHNACWVGSGSSTRSTIDLTEAYWDSFDGWTTGNGQMGSNGKPTGYGITFGRKIGYGLNAGPSWTFTDFATNSQQCMYNLHSW